MIATGLTSALTVCRLPLNVVLGLVFPLAPFGALRLRESQRLAQGFGGRGPQLQGVNEFHKSAYSGCGRLLLGDGKRCHLPSHEAVRNSTQLGNIKG